MKAAIGCAICATLAFVGMQMYQYMQRPEPSPPEQQSVAKTPLVTEKSSTEIKPKPESKSTVSSTKKTVAKRPTSTKKRITSTSSKSSGMYYTTEGGQNGKLPSRFIIHNTPGGKFPIQVYGFGSARGARFNGKGTTTMKGKKHIWEIRGQWGNVVVLWDGKTVSAR